MERDPVCGMDVDPATAQYRSDYQGRTYYFCAAECRREFDEQPERYIRGEGVA
jgi:Cu+-exporting ATPase